MIKKNSILGQLLSEMETLTPVRPEVEILEERTKKAFDVASRLMKFIDDNFSEEEAEDLKKRFVSSIRRGNLNKFDIALDRLRKKEESSDEEAD